tara:strand:- start:269 stop:421 length:153 start_codon:yes stop_codon:yes gene_type:complete
MGCGASVPKGEIDQELKQQKTKNDESQRQLDHMKELTRENASATRNSGAR